MFSESLNFTSHTSKISKRTLLKTVHSILTHIHHLSRSYFIQLHKPAFIIESGCRHASYVQGYMYGNCITGLQACKRPETPNSLGADMLTLKQTIQSKSRNATNSSEGTYTGGTYYHIFPAGDLTLPLLLRSPSPPQQQPSPPKGQVHRW